MLLCADYVLPISAEPIYDGAVLVQDGVIRDVGHAYKLRSRYQDEEVKELGDAVLMPGLVDLHTHLENAALRGVVHDVPYAKWATTKYIQAEKLDADDWAASALVGGMQALANGVTTVADVSINGSALNTVLKLGMRGVIYREVGAMDKTRVEFAMGQADKEISRWREKAAGTPTTIGIAPAHIFDCHPEVMRQVAKYAAKENIPVAMHLAGSNEEIAFVKHGSSLFSVSRAKRGYVEIPPWLPTGVSSVQYALNWDAFEAPNVMVVHGVHVDDADITALRKADVSICFTPRSNAQLGMGVPPIAEYLAQKMRAGFGTDSPAATDSADLLAEMRFGMLLTRATSKRFLSSEKALEMATLGAARSLRMDDRIGSLENGKRADIIAIDMSKNHLSPTKMPVSAIVHNAVGADVLLTMVDGKVLYENDKWAIGLTREQASESVNSIREKLRA